MRARRSPAMPRQPPPPGLCHGPGPPISTLRPVPGPCNLKLSLAGPASGPGPGARLGLALASELDPRPGVLPACQ
eukprot:2446068-Rhodomonas_salina.1